MPEAALRRRVGAVCAAFGLLHLAPAAFVLLSSAGPAPVLVSARAWSVFFYAHFIALTVAGLGIQGWDAARTKVFHGGPMIDFLIGATGFMVVETAAAGFLRRGEGPSWPALLPGAALVAFGLRLAAGRPLLK